MTEKEKAIDACGFLRGFSYLCSTSYISLAKDLYGDDLSTRNTEVMAFVEVLSKSIGTVCSYVESGDDDEG